MAGGNGAVVIVSAARTPVGSFNGALSGVPASYLGSAALKAAMSRANVEPGEIERFGHVFRLVPLADVAEIAERIFHRRERNGEN